MFGKLFSRKDTGSDSPDSPIGFGYKIAWLAVKSNDSQGIASEMGIKELSYSNWENGISSAYNGHVFLTPEIDGWILIPGIPFQNIDANARDLIQRLSKSYGECQLFITNRVTETHCWALANSENILRAYSYIGDQGHTPVEDNGYTHS